MLWRFRDVRMPGSANPRLDVAALEIPTGVTAVLGGSGAGKTTLLNLLVGFERAKAGEVRSQAADPKSVFWAPADGGLWPHLTVRQHLEAVLGRDGRHAARWLDTFELTHRGDARPATLSAGERDRLNVARALAAGTGAIVMDEPLVHVDGGLADRCWAAVREHVRRRGASLIFSTHQPEVALREAAHAVCLDAGRVLAAGEVQRLYWQPGSERVARALGRGNWLESDDARVWLGTDAPPHVVRPERLDIEPASSAPLRVSETRQAGASAESELVHEPTGLRRRFWHRARWPELPLGAGVALRVTCLLLACLFAFAGCDRAEPALQVKSVRHVPLPPDGQRVPAPRSVTIGPDDGVLVLDNGGRVLIFDKHGRLQRQWRMPDNKDGNPEGACFLQDGRIAVADTHYHRILFFDEHGNITGEWGKRTTSGEPGTFEYPVSLVQDEEGFVYVAEYGGFDRVQKFTPDGEFVLQFGKVGTGPGEFQRCAGISWFDDRLFVADASNGRVQVFDEQGNFIAVLGDERGPANFAYPYDVALAPDGSVFVVEWGAGRVARLTAEGEVLGRWGTPGSGIANLRTPWGIGVDSTMRVWVADTENRRLVELVL